MRISLSTLLLLALGGLCAGWGPVARASTFSYRVDQLSQPDPLDQNRRGADYRIYVDPSKTRWIAWSTSTTVSTYFVSEDSSYTQSQSSIVAGTHGENFESASAATSGTLTTASSMTLFTDTLSTAVSHTHYGVKVLDLPLAFGAKPAPFQQIMLTMTDPHGRVIGPLMMGSPGTLDSTQEPQVMVYGVTNTTPRVARFGENNKLALVDQSGIANDFIIAGGPGYFNLHFEIQGGDAQSKASQLFLLVDLMDELAPEGYASSYHSGAGYLDSGFFGSNGNNNNNGNGSPNSPNPEPVPEPATLALVGVGLAAMGMMRRRPARA